MSSSKGPKRRTAASRDEAWSTGPPVMILANILNRPSIAEVTIFCLQQKSPRSPREQGLFEFQPAGLLGIRRIVEQSPQSDRSMPELGITGHGPVARIEVRRNVVGREQDQRVEEGQDGVPIARGEGGESVPRRLGLAAVAQDDVGQRHAASVVAVGSGGAHAPQRRGDELPTDVRSVFVLVEI